MTFDLTPRERRLFDTILVLAVIALGFVVAGFIGVAFALFGDTNYLLHLHIHRPFSRSRVLNLILDLSMGAVTAMTAPRARSSKPCRVALAVMPGGGTRPAREPGGKTGSAACAGTARSARKSTSAKRVINVL